MSAEKDWALVLRVVPFSETSCVVTLFTRLHGKISALAKGARRPKSPFESALDLLAVCRVVFLHKSSESLDLLTEAKLEHRFHSSSRDLSRLYAAYYVVELLRELTSEDDPAPPLYDAAVNTVRALDVEGVVGREILRFELTALKSAGHQPTLDRCVRCSVQLSDQTRYAFGLLSGGVLCRKCRLGQPKVASVSKEGLEVLRVFADEDSDSWRTVTLDRRSRGELRGIMNSYLSHIIGRRPRMHVYLSV